MVRLGYGKPRKLKQDPFPDFDFDNELRLCCEDLSNIDCNIFTTSRYIQNMIWLCKPLDALNPESKIYKILKLAESTEASYKLGSAYRLINCIKNYLESTTTISV